MNDDVFDDYEENCLQRNLYDNKQNEPLRELITIKQAAEICGMSDQMFYSLYKRGKTPDSIKFGRLRRWRKREILNWIDAGCPDREVWQQLPKKRD